MVSRFPMICDSCLHKEPGQPVCTAFPDLIPLDPMRAEVHYTPRPDQDNDIVYELAPGKERAQQHFLGFRMAAIDAGIIEEEEEGSADEEEGSTADDDAEPEPVRGP